MNYFVILTKIQFIKYSFTKNRRQHFEYGSPSRGLNGNGGGGDLDDPSSHHNKPTTADHYIPMDENNDG